MVELPKWGLERLSGVGSIDNMPTAAVLEEVQTRELPLALRADFVPNSLDKGERTVELLLSAGSPVDRRDWYTGERWIEELSLKPGHVRLERLQSGAPLLDSHSSYSCEYLIGSVVPGSARIVEDQGRAELRVRVRFNQRAVDHGIWSDVEQGHLRACSMGYRIFKKVLVEEREAMPKRYSVVDWEIFEASMVLMGADPVAGVRSANQGNVPEPNSCVIVRELKPMPQVTTEENKPATVTPNEEARRAEIAAAEEAAVRGETERQTQVRALCAKHKLGDDFARTLLERAPRVTLDAARAAILEELERRDQSAPTDGHHVGRVEVGATDKQKRVAAMSDGLLLRAGSLDYNAPKDSARRAVEGAREFAGMSLVRFAAEVLRVNGVDTSRMTDVEIAERAVAPAHGPSDFPAITANVMNKSLSAGYEESPRTFLPLVDEEQFTNLLPKKAITLGTLGDLVKVPNNGEIRHVSLGDSGQDWSVIDYALIFGLTRATILNDTLSALTTVPALAGNAGARLESDLFWALVTGGQVMQETGLPLFDAGHLNTGTGVIDVAGISTGYEKISTQKSPQGALLSLYPRYLVVPTTRWAAAVQFTASIAPNTAGSVNPFGSGSPMPLVPIAEPRLNAASAAQWYLVATSPMKPAAVGRMAGQASVYLENRIGFERDGLEIKARHTFGAVIKQQRQWYRSTGS